MYRLFCVNKCVHASETPNIVFLTLQGADLQTKPEGKMTQPVNMVQLLTVRQNPS